MVAKTAREAVDRFVDRIRLTIQCATRAEVQGTGSRVDQDLGLVFSTFGPTPRGRDLLSLSQGSRALSFLLRPAIAFRVSPSPNQYGLVVSITGYAFTLFDSEQYELFAYHWHTDGYSQFQTPHLHISGARPFSVASRFGEPIVQSLHIAKAHLPTGQIQLEDVIELLIVDPVFAVEPRRADWQRVLTANRAEALAEQKR